MTAEAWYEANQRYLVAEVARVGARLTGETPVAKGPDTRAIQDSMEWPPALEVARDRFALSPFERDVLLMCAGPELDSALASKIDTPTFGMALARLEKPHWSALTPAAALRHWRLVEPGAGKHITSAALRIDERILHYLAGVQHLDERLANAVEPFPGVGRIADSHRQLADRIAEEVETGEFVSSGMAIALVGPDRGGKRAVASAVAERLGFDLLLLPGEEIPASGQALHDFIRLWQREERLAGPGLYIDLDDPAGASSETRDGAIRRLLDGLSGPVILGAADRYPGRYRSIRSFDVPYPTPSEQRRMWFDLLGPRADRLDGEVDRVAAQFTLGLDALVAAREDIAGALAQDAPGTDVTPHLLWDACRRQARPRLEGLAQRVRPRATWSDLVLPDTRLGALRNIAVQVRRRHLVYEDWNWASRCARGLGISALFAGGSGTGKTTAAEVLAGELRLDLYRVDVSSVVSKYIGETEKNLRKIFDAAEEGGVILLFDEADALFGKRSEVKDSHDRYANIEVSYLLQRMESYRGLAILTTNRKSSIDQAFLRRLRFVVDFPFPDAEARQRIWQGVFPARTPTEKLDTGKLARLDLSGGNIRNIALSAAFHAAEERAAVRMDHLLAAARSEYEKLERPLNEAEVRGWGGCE